MTADIIKISSQKAAAPAPIVLNERELVSLDALFAYTAHDRKVSEDFVREAVANRYGIKDIRHLPSTSFEDAIRFLVDFQTAMILN